MTKSVDPDGFTTAEAYDPAGNATKTVDANNRIRSATAPCTAW